MPPADSASRAGVMPKASGDPSSGTLARNIALITLVHFFTMKTIASIAAAITFALLYTASAQEKGFPEIGASYYFTYALEKTPSELRGYKIKIIEKGEAQWCLIEYQPNPPNGAQSNAEGSTTAAQTPPPVRVWFNLSHVLYARKVSE